MKITDGHVHIQPPHIKEDCEAIAAREYWFDTLIHSKINKWGTSEELIFQMTETGVERALVTSFAFKDQGLCREVNDYVLDAAGRYPGRVVPLAVVSPLAPGAEAEIARCAALGAVGVGELFPDGQGFDLADEAQTRGLAGACADAGLFLMFHTAEQIGHSYPGKGKTGAEQAARFCMNHPDARVVFAHFGGGLWAYESMPEMRKLLVNAWYDTAAWPWLYSHEIMDAIFASGAGHKMIYGSDWPILTYPRYEKLIGRCRITEEQKTMLFSSNAERLLYPENEG